MHRPRLRPDPRSARRTMVAATSARTPLASAGRGVPGCALLLIPDRSLRAKNLFSITLGIYLLFTVATAFSWNFWSFALFRFLAEAGIGGEYSAIYSAIDELIPARIRGQVALAISGSYWGGAAVGSLLSAALLSGLFVPMFYGWRLAFGIGAILGLGVLLIRRYVPETRAGSPPTDETTRPRRWSGT